MLGIYRLKQLTIEKVLRNQRHIERSVFKNTRFMERDFYKDRMMAAGFDIKPTQSAI